MGRLFNMRGLTLVIAVFFGTAADAVPTNSQSALDSWVARNAEILPSVWEDELKTAIQQTYPNVDAKRLASMHLKVDRNTCEVIPNIDEAGQITIATGFIYFMLVAEQPVFFEVLGEPRYKDAGRIYEYYSAIGRQARFDMDPFCKRGDKGAASGMKLETAGHYFGVSEQEYDATERRHANDPQALKLGDYIGGAAEFFVVLHEAGHYLLGRPGGPEDPDAELEADEFAAAVMREENLSTSLSLWTLQLLAPSPKHPGKVEKIRNSIACRIARLLQAEPNPGLLLANSGLATFAANAAAARSNLLDIVRADCS